MTEKKRFYKAYCCGDTGVIDGLENEWFIENINSISDIEKNWDTVIDKLNQVAEENEKLKHKVNGLKSELTIWKEDANEHIQETNKLFEGNKQLKKYNKGQELEIIRLHNLADAMSAVLRELGIYDVYNDEQIENVKRRIIND